MAQRTVVELVDDLDGTASSDVSTVLFALDGAEFEIDLSEANAERLRKTLTEFVDNARRVGGRLKRGTRPSAGTSSTSGTEAAEVRAWAAANGVELSGRGRIPNHVITAYREDKNKAKVMTPAKVPAKTSAKTAAKANGGKAGAGTRSAPPAQPTFTESAAKRTKRK